MFYVYENILLWIYIENLLKVYFLKKVRFSAFKNFRNFFLMCCELQRHIINLILRVSIEFSFLKENFVLMCCKLQRHEINSIKVLFINK